MGGFCLGGFVQKDFVRGDIVLGGILSGEGFVRGFCPRAILKMRYKSFFNFLADISLIRCLIIL